MANIVEFIIRMQDGLSGPLAVSAKNSGAAKSALDSLTESNKNLNRMLQPTGKSINDISSRLAKLKEYRDMLPSGAERQIKKINEEMTKLNGQMQKMETLGAGSKNWFKDAFNTLPEMMKNPVVLAAVGAGALFKTAFTKGMNNSKEKLDLQNLVGENAGGALFGQLSKQKKRTGEGTMDAAKGLLMGGVGADEVTPMLERIGNVAAGDAGKLTQLAGAFGQLRQEGKLTESTLSALTSGGFKPLELMHRATGESMAKLETRLAKGTITFGEVEAALAKATEKGGQFNGVLDRLNSGPIGALERMKNAFSDAAGVLGDRLMPIADVVFNGMADGIDGTVNLMRELVKWGRENEGVLTTLAVAVTAGAGAWGLYQAGLRAAWMWQMKDLVVTSLLTTAKGAQTVMTGGLTAAWMGLNAAMTANPIGVVMVLVAGLVAGVMVAWNKFEGFRKVMFGLWETTKQVFTSIGNLFALIFSPIGEAISAIEKRDWIGAAKATGQLLFNLTPMGIAMATKDFVNDGGFDNVKGAHGRGEEKGAASWAASQKEKKANDPLIKEKDPIQELITYHKSTGRDEKTKAGINAVSGGGSKTIAITVNKMVETMNWHVNNSVRESVADMERMVEEALVRTIASATGR